MDVLYLLAALLVMVALQGLFLRWFGLRGLTYARSFSKKEAFAGETVEMVEVLRNAKLLPVPWIKAESRMSVHLRFSDAEGDDALHEHSSDTLYHRSTFFLAPYSQVTRRSAVQLLKRGRYEVGTVSLTAGDLFATITQRRETDTGAAISVYPRLLAREELALPSSRWQGELGVRRWIMPDPFLIAGIREWQQGDAQRDVHWAATARTGALQVKAHDYTADPKLLVILNVQMKEQQWSDLMEYEQGVIEYGISLAASLCLHALESGVEAGFAANAPTLPDRERPTLLLPARHPGRDRDLLETMARLHIRRLRSFHTFLEDFSQVQGMDIIILSAYHSELLAQRIAQLQLRGNTVTLWELPQEVSA